MLILFIVILSLAISAKNAFIIVQQRKYRAICRNILNKLLSHCLLWLLWFHILQNKN